MRNVLIDSGPLIALFATDDRHHQHFDALLDQGTRAGLRLITTWPCVVEAGHLLDAPLAFELLEWVERGGVQVFPFDAVHLGPMVGWMRRYGERHKRQMDLADASLLWVALETGVREIMTIDLNDFARYRLPDGSALAIL